jgi:hypothetical protein
MTTVTKVGNTLIVSSDRIPPAINDALPLALLWCQTVARTKGDTLGSDAYFADLSSEMGRIAWNVTDAGKTTFSVTASTAQPVQSVLTIAQSLVPPDQLAIMSDLISHIKVATTNDQFGNFLTTWWDQRNVDAHGTVFAAAPAWVDDNLQLQTTLVQFDYAITSNSWQSFFLGQLNTGAKVTARNITLTLNAPLWAPIKSPIAQKLGQAAIAAITSLDL